MESDEEQDGNNFGSLADDNILFKKQALQQQNATTANAYQKQISGLDLTGLGVGQRFEEYEDSGFDYVDGKVQNDTTKDIFGNTFGNFGSVMGGVTGLEEAEALEKGQNIGGMEEGMAQNTMQVSVFISFDEDEPNQKSIDLNQLFQREDIARPYFVELEVRDHYSNKELIVDAIDAFNKRLQELNAKYRLDDNLDKLEDNYRIYIAKKKGHPNDDYPALSMASGIKNFGKKLFAVGIFMQTLKASSTTAIAASSNQLRISADDEEMNILRNINSSKRAEQSNDTSQVQNIQNNPLELQNNNKHANHRSTDIKKEEALLPQQSGCCCSIY